jgi:hypothetical protein
MKKTLLVIFLASNCLFGITLDDVVDLYKKGDYHQACIYAASIYERMGHNEPYLSLYGYACLKSDNINSLAKPIMKLVKTKEGRADARYFASVLFQKKMLYAAVVDNEDISYINLPNTEYILSQIFTKYVRNDFEKDGDAWVFQDENDESTKHIMTLVIDGEYPKLYLKTYKADKLIKTRVYW